LLTTQSEFNVTQPYARMPAMLHKYGMPSESCNSIYISYAARILASLRAKTIRLEKVGCFGFRSQRYSENHLSNISIGFHDIKKNILTQKKKKKKRKEREKREKEKKGLHFAIQTGLPTSSTMLENVQLFCIYS
jgi:predicted N-acyltransferase